MLRKDIKYMIEKDWEPKVPDIKVIRKQTTRRSGKVSGSVRLAIGLVSTGERLSHYKDKHRVKKSISTK
ncbi:MAG: hypothetical protein J1E35_07050 [Lachnospiraceae bacterium]|nr:hypothetical protein [Lachnospiraceae bacterium]